MATHGHVDGGSILDGEWPSFYQSTFFGSV